MTATCEFCHKPMPDFLLPRHVRCCPKRPHAAPVLTTADRLEARGVGSSVAVFRQLVQAGQTRRGQA